jgi:hypothetical protein
VIDAPDGNGQVAVKRGPIVLALDDRLAPPRKDAAAVLERTLPPLLNVKPNADAAKRLGAWMAFDVPFLVGGKRGALTMCDYASAGNRWSEDNRFRAWLPQPLNLETAYATGVTWKMMTPFPSRPEAPPPANARRSGMKTNRILFLGNSITFHPPASNVGWAGNWGMAASAAEKDYVHLLVNSIDKSTGKKPDFRAVNIADFERQHDKYNVDSGLWKYLNFRADIVVVAIGENVPALTTEQSRAKYKAALSRLLNALKGSSQPVIYVRSCFWPDKIKDDIMRECCVAAGGVFVDIGGLSKDESNSARSERSFAHAGVAGHPGDKGMKAIADALWKAMTAHQPKSLSAGDAPKR